MSLRDEILGPLRGLNPRAVVAGSFVLAGLLFKLLGRALRAALRAGKDEQPAPKAARVPLAKKLRKKEKTTEKAEIPAGADAGAAEPAPVEAAPEAAKTAPAAKTTAAEKTGAVGDRLEQLGIGVLAVLTLGGVLGGGVSTLVGFLYGMIAPYLPAVLVLLAAAWILAAAALAPTPENDHETEEAGEEPERSPQEEEAARLAAAELWLLRLVLDGVGTAVKDGRKGVHLATLLESIPADWTVTTLRAHCERLRIPVKKINIRGQGNTWGVHVDELETALGMGIWNAIRTLDYEPVRTPAESAPETPVEEVEPTPAESLPEAPVEEAEPTPAEAAEEVPLATLLELLDGIPSQPSAGIRSEADSQPPLAALVALGSSPSSPRAP